MSDEKRKVDGHRRAVREHIEKYKRYPSPDDKRTALKTIENAQRHITKLRHRSPSIASSYEDTWRP